LSDPANGSFLQALASGRVPPELLPPPPADGTPLDPSKHAIDVKLEDKRNQEWVKPDYVAFEGQGNSLKADDGDMKVEAVGTSEGEGGGRGRARRAD